MAGRCSIHGVSVLDGFLKVREGQTRQEEASAQKKEGPNDGIVSLTSATFGESTEVWEGDHFSLVNWLHPFGRHRGFWRDPAKRYGPLIRRLKDEGL